MQITNEQILALFSALIPVIVSLATYMYKVLIGRLPMQKQALLQQVATQAVHMAEQVVGSGNGASKKAMVEQTLNAALKSWGLKVDPTLVNTAIEAGVYSLNQHAPHLVIEPVDTSKNHG